MTRRETGKVKRSLSESGQELWDTAKLWKPPSDNQKCWRPLSNRGWEPLNEVWKSVIVRDDRAAIIKPLEDMCVKKLEEMWNGNPQSVVCEHHQLRMGSPHFHCYPITKGGPEWQRWRDHADYDKQKNNIWWCTNLRNAADHWSWEENPAETFEQLAAALQSAIRSGDEWLTAVVCLQIVRWGGVDIVGRAVTVNTVNWLSDKAKKQQLIASLLDATGLLCPRSNSPLARFNGTDLLMNSATTKIFSAVAMDFGLGYAEPRQDVIIFDSRVSVGLGLLARRLTFPHRVPDEFRFPRDPAATRGPKGQKRKIRDTNCPPITFPGMNQTGMTQERRARFARTASRCVQQVLGTYDPSQEFIAAEKALFMVGYNVNDMCCGCRRPCP